MINKKVENVLNAVEGPNSLSLETETTLNFIAGGGSYLLTLDDNFVVDRTVTFPLIHMVHFDNERKISQIRLHWDQGSLLKQIEVINSRHWNWPIRDGPEQTRLINSSVCAAPKFTRTDNQVDEANVASQTLPTDTSAFTEKKSEISSCASASHFELQNEAHVEATYKQNLPRGVPEHEPTQVATKKHLQLCEGRVNSLTTPKPTSKTFQHFEFGESNALPSSTKSSKAYAHFEFGEARAPLAATTTEPGRAQCHLEVGEDIFMHTKPSKDTSRFGFENVPSLVTDPEVAIRPRSSRHTSQWDFKDFMTPDKPRQRNQERGVRHFAWSDDNCDLPDTPKENFRTVRARRDTESHFEFKDDGPRGTEQSLPSRTIGTAHTKGFGLYENNLYGDTGGSEQDSETQPPFPCMLNVNRRKDFDSHWAMTDEPLPNTVDANENERINHDHVKAVNMMSCNWDVYDESNDSSAQAVHVKRVSRNDNQPSWAFGDEGDF
ncbi:hypothetical protein PRK78_003885 [Emydomyces testavorans]|uniref:Uncharacterized protein n=1 Tax=Emydomyces testavorans TaxID=2070801 RepID=A0AAF0DIW8_9EURO|nr:hypothetical protein PRK78_003885 [Emydomyces testavorans]